MMRKLILVAILVLPVMLHAQNTFTLNVKTQLKETPAKIYLIHYTATARLTDSATFSNGICQFKGAIEEPGQAMLVAGKLSSKDILKLFLDKGVIHIEMKDSLKYATVTGPQATMDFVRYQKLLSPSQKVLDSLSEARQAALKKPERDTIKANAIMEQIEIGMRPYKEAQKKFIKANPNSYVSMIALNELSIGVLNLQLVEPLFNSLSAKVRESSSARRLKTLIDKKKMLQIGQIAPDFTQNDVNDHPVKLSDFRGKYVLVDFWASWCVPCRAENPYVVKAYNNFKNKNFTVLSVSLDGPGKKADWLAAIKADGLTWTQVSDLRSFNNAAAELYGIKSIPQNFLLDKKGKIVAVNLRGEALEKKIAGLLN